jgi:hypothetical protein
MVEKKRFQTRFASLALIVSLVLCGANASGATVWTEGVVSLENSVVRVKFDLDAGVYSAEDVHSGTVLWQNAAMRLATVAFPDDKWRSLANHWTTNDPKTLRRSAEVLETADALGRGKTLKVVTEHPETTLELSITLYDNRPGIVLGCGCRNRRQRPMMLGEFCPLLGAEVFPGDRRRGEPLTLDGAGGSSDNGVRPGLYRESLDNVLLTYLGDAGRRSIVLGGLTYREWSKTASLSAGPNGTLLATLSAKDPVGRMLDGGASYPIADRFYLDFQTADPFVALEQYAEAAMTAQPAAPNLYNLPTICTWYVAVTGGSKRRDTVGAVEQMDIVRSTGFLKYSPVAVRLVPDTYCTKKNGLSEQGWWDDAHWQRHGWYNAPYETSEKFCRAIRQRGGLPFTYVMTNMPSDDFAQAHPQWMLHNDIRLLPLQHSPQRPFVRIDYSDPGLQAYMRKVWSDLGRAGLAGVFFDYPHTGWAGEGGLEDPHYTAAAAYRKIFELAREGLGPHGHIQERLLPGPGSQYARADQWLPLGDLTLGVVDSQRVETDCTLFLPRQVSRCALRWYKNRRLYVYDADAKSLLLRIGRGKTQPVADPALRRRAMLTMLYVAVGRVLLADSFKDYTPEMLHDLARLFPMHPERRVARPVDAFLPEGRTCPRVYDFAVTPQWHQVALFNPDFDAVRKIGVPLAGDTVSQGALGLERTAEYYVYDFWNDRLAGRLKGTEVLSQELQPGEARMLSVRKVEARPQALSTDRHLMQGYVDMPGRPRWDAARKTLSGVSQVVAAEPYRIVLAGNGRTAQSAAADGASVRLEAHPQDNRLQRLVIESPNSATVAWRVSYHDE